MKRATLSPGMHGKERPRRALLSGLRGLAGLALLSALPLPATTPVALLGPAQALAQQTRNAKEAAQDRAELARDRRELADDVADVRRLEALVFDLDRARAMRDVTAEMRARNRIRAFLNREIAETRREVARDRVEAKRAARELEAERSEVAGDRRELREARTYGSPREREDAARDLRLDRRTCATIEGISATTRGTWRPRRPGS